MRNEDSPAGRSLARTAFLCVSSVLSQDTKFMSHSLLSNHYAQQSGDIKSTSCCISTLRRSVPQNTSDLKKTKAEESG